MNHSDTSPSFKFYPETTTRGKIANILPIFYCRTPDSGISSSCNTCWCGLPLAISSYIVSGSGTICLYRFLLRTIRLNASRVLSCTLWAPLRVLLAGSWLASSSCPSSLLRRSSMNASMKYFNVVNGKLLDDEYEIHEIAEYQDELLPKNRIYSNGSSDIYE